MPSLTPFNPSRRFDLALPALALAAACVLPAHAQPAPGGMPQTAPDRAAMPMPPAPGMQLPPSGDGFPAAPGRGAPPPRGRAPLPVPPASPFGPDAVVPPATPTEGRVTAYLLSPEAEVSGVILDDGHAVRVPPHLGAPLAAMVKPGDRVRFSGEPPARPGVATPAQAWTITAVSTGRTLSDTPPDPVTPPTPPALARQGQSALQAMKTSGTVKRVLTGPRGEATGVLLDNGTQVAIPPQAPEATDRLLTIGARIDVEGYGRTSTFGTALQATVLSRPGETPVSIYAPVPLR